MHTKLEISYYCLNLHNLKHKSGTALAQVFTAIPASVTSLDLSMNSLGKELSKEIAQILGAIQRILIASF